MEQKIILARLFISDQDKSPLKIDKRKWAKQHDYSTQTLYEGLRKLKNEIDISKYIKKDGKTFGTDGRFCKKEIERSPPENFKENTSEMRKSMSNLDIDKQLRRLENAPTRKKISLINDRT